MPRSPVIQGSVSVSERKYVSDFPSNTRSGVELPVTDEALTVVNPVHKSEEVVQLYYNMLCARLGDDNYRITEL